MKRRKAKQDPGPKRQTEVEANEPISFHDHPVFYLHATGFWALASQTEMPELSGWRTIRSLPVKGANTWSRVIQRENTKQSWVFMPIPDAAYPWDERVEKEQIGVLLTWNP